MINTYPELLNFKPGDIVLVGEAGIGKALKFIGYVRDPLEPKAFQVSNVDTEEIHLVNGEVIRGTVSTRES